MKKETKIKSLRTYHAFFAVLSLMTLLIIIFMDNWGDWYHVLMILVAICFDGKFEKNDELTKEYLGKANTVAMWFLMVALAMLYMRGRFHPIPATRYIIIICAALFLRSVVFLVFDRPLKSEDE